MRTEILEKEEQLENNMHIKKNLIKIYNSLPKPKNVQKERPQEGWINVADSQNSKNVFEIPKILDSEDFLPELAAKEIMNYWKDNYLLNEYQKSVIEILKMVKIYRTEFNLEPSFVSSKVYELF